MRLLSANVGRETPVEGAGKSGKTGTFERPVDGPVETGPPGPAGDTITDTKHPGGPDRAVRVIGAPDCAWSSEQLGRGLPRGTFGENLRLPGFESAAACIGDRFTVGIGVFLAFFDPSPGGGFAAPPGGTRSREGQERPRAEAEKLAARA